MNGFLEKRRNIAIVRPSIPEVGIAYYNIKFYEKNDYIR